MTLKAINMEKEQIQDHEPNQVIIPEREEGEISDLDLEDVSDCSLTSQQSFKKYKKSPTSCFKSRDSLYFSCISEDSDTEMPAYGCKSSCRTYNCDGFDCTYNRSPRPKHYDRKYKYKCGRKRSRAEITTKPQESSDSNSDVDRSLLQKLNKAVRVNEVPESSLRSRLNKMEDKDGTDSECELMELRKVALESKLRESNKVEQKPSDEDEETKLRVEALRSAFLKKASLRRQKKIKSGSQELDDVSVQIKTVMNDLLDYIISDSEQPSTDSNSVDFKPRSPVPTDEVSIDSNVVDFKPKNESPVPIPKDDEDEDILRAMLLTSVAKNINKKVPPVIKPAPKVIDIPVKPLVIRLGEDSDTDSSIDLKPKVPSSFEASLSQFLKNARADSDKQSKTNSVLQQLSESKKLEYLQLTKRLEQLSKNPKIKQNQVKKVETKKVPVSLKKVARVVDSSSTKSMPLRPVEHNLSIKKMAASKKHAATVADTLVNQKRFLAGKYKELTPIVKKTKAARIQRDRAGEEVTRLIEELRKARVRYNDCHQTFKNCVQQYLVLKANISADVPVGPMKRPMDEMSTTKKRFKVQEFPFKALRASATVDTVKAPVKVAKQRSVVTKKQYSLNNVPLKQPVPVEEKSTVSDPAIKAQRRCIDTNPLIEVCPFDMQGSCRDVECKYRHLG